MMKRKELRILQYNVHKSRSKIMIALLQKKKIRDYDILIIQKSWRFDERAKTYNSCRADFALKNNEERTCFYINKRIDNNNWHTTWHFKNVSTVTLQLREDDDENAIEHESIHIHEVYNSLLTDHNKINDKESLSQVAQTMRMRDEDIAIENFNLHHSIWVNSFYSKQHLLSNELLNIMREVDVSLTLSRDIITKDYQDVRTTIDLFFTISEITNRPIYCEINDEMKNSFDHIKMIGYDDYVHMECAEWIEVMW